MRFNILFVFFLLIISIFLSCKKDSFITDNNSKLSFSTDTVMFDTVFTTIGSTTKQLKVHNPYNKSIKISSIFLAGSNSNFRLNINGRVTNNIKDIEIAPKDSIFIFVEVTVNPNKNTPIVVNDSIIFVTNGNIQDVKLVAFGQDVILVDEQIFNNNTTWTNNKPFLIYNSMLVDSGITLTIQQGTKLYFHKNSRLYVKGTLKVNGTLDQQVFFMGDRLEQMYKDVPGQWEGIFFVAGSKDNSINYGVIKNAIIGIRVDTMASLTIPTLILSNTKIENMSSVGLFAQGSFIRAYNCIIDNCNQYAVDLSIGGSYEFYHCTIANYWEYSNRSTPALNINNYYQDLTGTYRIREIALAYFGNCIIYGNKECEIGLDSFSGIDDQYFNYTFDHCLIKANSELKTSNARDFKDIIVNNDPKFKDINNYDYTLDTMSVAMNKGDLSIVNLFPFYLITDFNNVNRTSYGLPDIGAYERKEQ